MSTDCLVLSLFLNIKCLYQVIKIYGLESLSLWRNSRKGPKKIWIFNNKLHWKIPRGDYWKNLEFFLNKIFQFFKHFLFFIQKNYLYFTKPSSCKCLDRWKAFLFFNCSVVWPFSSLFTTYTHAISYIVLNFYVLVRICDTFLILSKVLK